MACKRSNKDETFGQIQKLSFFLNKTIDPEMGAYLIFMFVLHLYTHRKAFFEICFAKEKNNKGTPSIT
jgi:hypothetical protein